MAHGTLRSPRYSRCLGLEVSRVAAQTVKLNFTLLDEAWKRSGILGIRTVWGFDSRLEDSEDSEDSMWKGFNVQAPVVSQPNVL